MKIILSLKQKILLPLQLTDIKCCQCVSTWSYQWQFCYSAAYFHLTFVPWSLPLCEWYSYGVFPANKWNFITVLTTVCLNLALLPDPYQSHVTTTTCILMCCRYQCNVQWKFICTNAIMETSALPLKWRSIQGYYCYIIQLVYHII
jgi:hypothetical protein